MGLDSLLARLEARPRRKPSEIEYHRLSLVKQWLAEDTPNLAEMVSVAELQECLKGAMRLTVNATGMPEKTRQSAGSMANRIRAMMGPKSTEWLEITVVPPRDSDSPSY